MVAKEWKWGQYYELTQRAVYTAPGTFMESHSAGEEDNDE